MGPADCGPSARETVVMSTIRTIAFLQRWPTLTRTSAPCPLDARVAQFRVRAFESMLAVAMANYPRSGSRSCAFDEMAFSPAERSPVIIASWRRAPPRKSARPY